MAYFTPGLNTLRNQRYVEQLHVTRPPNDQFGPSFSEKRIILNTSSSANASQFPLRFEIRVDRAI